MITNYQTLVNIKVQYLCLQLSHIIAIGKIGDTSTLFCVKISLSLLFIIYNGIRNMKKAVWLFEIFKNSIKEGGLYGISNVGWHKQRRIFGQS